MTNADIADTDPVEGGEKLSASEVTRRWMIAQVHKELEAMSHVETLPPVRRRAANSVSTVYSIRLDNDELAALERAASVRGMRPTVLARNLIRAGLTTDVSRALLAEKVERLETLVEELRGFVP